MFPVYDRHVRGERSLYVRRLPPWGLGPRGALSEHEKYMAFSTRRTLYLALTSAVLMPDGPQQ